jgi:hypothetical protein
MRGTEVAISLGVAPVPWWRWSTPLDEEYHLPQPPSRAADARAFRRGSLGLSMLRAASARLRQSPWGRLVVLAMMFGVSSCGGLHAQMAAADRDPCEKVLARHESVSRAPDYASQDREFREGYEVQVVRCAMARNKFEVSAAIAKGWSDHIALEREQTLSRAEAGLGNDTAAAEHLEVLAKNVLSDEKFFVESPELRRYRSEDWFVGLAIRVWSRHADGSLYGFVSELLGRDALLPLRVVVADPHREKGQWVVWTGKVQDARLDSDANQTLFLAEGVDVRKQTMGPEEVESRYTLKGHTLEQVSRGTSYMVEEELVPNGHKFYVHYPRAKDSLAAMQTIVAVGHYDGRGGADNLPVVSALVVMERKARRTSEKEERGGGQ